MLGYGLERPICLLTTAVEDENPERDVISTYYPLWVTVPQHHSCHLLPPQVPFLPHARKLRLWRTVPRAKRLALTDRVTRGLDDGRTDVHRFSSCTIAEVVFPGLASKIYLLLLTWMLLPQI